MNDRELWSELRGLLIVLEADEQRTERKRRFRSLIAKIERTLRQGR